MDINIHQCSQEDRIDSISKGHAATQNMLNDVERELHEHREAQQKRDASMDIWMKKQDTLMLFVEENLVPAYKREVNAENAKKYIKERAKSWSFWVGVMMGTITLFWAVIYVFKKILGIDKY